MPFYGVNALITAATRYLPVGGTVGPITVEAQGQWLVPDRGILELLAIQNVAAGADSIVAVYQVNKNGVAIPGATVSVNNTSTVPVLVELDALLDGSGHQLAQVVAGDLIDISIVVPAMAGASPVVRAALYWAPGKNPL